MRLSDTFRLIREYNIFDTNSIDLSIVRIQRWSTRLYIIVVWLAMMVLIIYTSLHVSTREFRTEKPSLSTYLLLYKEHANIECPCVDISTSYRTFLQLSPSYHQICSSELLSDRWIHFLFDHYQTTSRYAADFRATARQQFQILRELCQLSINAVEHGLETLYSRELISGYLLSQDFFEAKLQADIMAFERITSEHFGRELALVRSLISGNQLMPAVETAFTIIVRSDTSGVIRSEPGVNINRFRSSNDSECQCTDSLSCHMSAGFYDILRFDTSRGVFDQVVLPPRELLDHWYTGCWPSESLFLSNLVQFYNQTALNRIVNYVNSSVIENVFRVLNSSQNSTFDTDMTIEMLVEELFIERWKKELNYTAYFDQCQPEMCIFDVNERASLLYVVPSLLGLYGGLSVALLFATPYVVMFIFNHRQPRQTDPEEDQPRSNRIQKLWHRLINLNLFKSKRKITEVNQRWSTRMYIILLTLAVFFFTLYTGLNIDTKIVHVKHPSLTTVQRLQSRTSSLQCPCTKISIAYEDLINLEPKYHQICSSEFVGSKWIEGLSQIAASSIENLYYADFRYSSSIFQLLKSMCDLANDTIINALYVFGQTQLVTANLAQLNFFTEQLDSALAQFQSTTPNALLRLLQLTRNITYMNQFLSGSYANFFVNYSVVKEYAQSNMTLGIYGNSFTLSNGTKKSCSCANDIECGRQAALYTGPSGRRKVIFLIPGFYSRCFPVESLLPSTLECFYDDQPCLDAMANATNEPFFVSITRLNASQTSRFAINTTINDLLGQLFIESWSSNLSYEKYFTHCRPTACSYTVNTQKSTLELVTTVTGLIGGLSVVLRFVIPYVISTGVMLLRKYRLAQVPIVPRQENPRTTVRITALRGKIGGYITELNIFGKFHRPPINELELLLQRQSTRLYFLLLAIALFILIVYTSLIYQKNTNTIKIVSLEQFEQLQTRYVSNTIECPCTNISFQRATFYRMEPIFHQVCSSDFIDTHWLNTLFESYQNQHISEMNSLTFIGTAFAYFQSLRIMCGLTKQAVMDVRELFLNTQVIVTHMLHYDLFLSQTTAALISFNSTLSDSFVHSLKMLLGMAHGNGLVSGYSTNWGVFLPNMTKDATIYTRARIYGDCNCATSSACTAPSIPHVPGFVVACLPIESLLRSTFECLYNQTCVDIISSYVNASIIPTALNEGQSGFSPYISTNDIVQKMFIESWFINISYENFYQQCQPKFCSHTLIERNNILYVVTTIVGLYGGLTVLLKLIVPFAVRRMHALIRRRREHVQVRPIDERF